MNQLKEFKTIQMVTRQKVLQLTGWDELRLGNFIMQQGEVYLNNIFGEEAKAVKRLTDEQTFWGWFKNHWHRRDLRFVATAKGLSQQDAEQLYILTNDGEAINFKPHASIMRVAFINYQPDETDQIAQMYDEMEYHLNKAEELADRINAKLKGGKA